MYEHDAPKMNKKEIKKELWRVSKEENWSLWERIKIRIWWYIGRPNKATKEICKEIKRATKILKRKW